MYHKFTGMPKRGFARQIMPPMELHPIEHWRRLGIPDRLLHRTDFEGQELYSFVFDGPLFYEIAERRLDREDYERRLAARTVQRWEWYSREKSRRGIMRSQRRHPGIGPTSEQQEAFAYQVMGELLTGIVEHARNRETHG